MHTLLVLLGTLLNLAGGYLGLGTLQRLSGWSARRDIQFLVLVAPVVSLGLAVGSLYHFTGRPCFLNAPSWDSRLATLLPLGMGSVALGGLVLGLVRLGLMGRIVARSGRPADAALQVLADHLADQMGTRRPRVLLCDYDQPLALACGLLRPSVLLSSWMVEHLDQRELESVLAHELAHVARRDYLVVWLATVLRDAFVYLPTSWAAYRQLQHDKELASDDLAIGATRRPLALASALAKVWQRALRGQQFGTAPLLTGTGEPIEGRIERLLATPSAASSSSASDSRRVALIAGSTALAGLLVLEAIIVTLMLVPMGCGLAAPLGGVV